MDLTLGSNDGLDAQALRPLSLEGGDHRGCSCLAGPDGDRLVGLAHGLLGTNSWVMLSSWTPVPSPGFKGAEGHVDRHQRYKSVASGKSK